LEIPLHLAGCSVERDRAAGKEVVTWAIGAVEAGNRVAGSPIGQVRVRIVGTGDVKRAAACLPGIVLVLPGLAARLPWGGHRVGLPLHIPGPRIKRGDPVAHAAVPAG